MGQLKVKQANDCVEVSRVYLLTLRVTAVIAHPTMNATLVH